MKLLLDWPHMKLENKDGMDPLHRSAGDLKFALDMLVDWRRLSCQQCLQTGSPTATKRGHRRNGGAIR